MTPQEWLAELEALVADQPNQIRAELRAEAAGLASMVARSAQRSRGAISSATAVDTADGARVVVRASSAGQRMLDSALARRTGPMDTAIMSTDGLVLSQ